MIDYHLPNFDISVILPCFIRDKKHIDRQLDLLLRSLQSVISQDYPGVFEILIIDDGSLLDISNLLKDESIIKKNPVRFIRHFRNYGLVHALNTGIVNSKYALLARIDLDDIWLPGKINKQISLYKQDENLTIVGTGMKVLYDEPEDHIRPSDWTEIIKFFYSFGCPFPHGSILARKDIYRIFFGYNHDPDFRHCEDYALWGKWIRFFKPAMIQEVLFEYTVGQQSISTLFKNDQRTASGKVCSLMLNHPYRDNIPELIDEVASSLNIDTIHAGFLIYFIWNYCPIIYLPKSSFSSISKLLYDRRLTRIIGASKHIKPYKTLSLIGHTIPLEDNQSILIRTVS